MHSILRRSANVAALLFVFLAIAFVSRDSIIIAGVDTVHHLVLVDELARHHTVLPADASRLEVMSIYPSGSHWVAALLAPVAGSGLVAMTWVAIGSIFLCYAMLFWLAQRDLGIASAAVFAAILFIASPLQSLIGWEIIDNFFYPQLVANALLLAFLCLTVLSGVAERLLPALTPLFGAVLMNFHPLVAIQAMGAGLTIMMTTITHQWWSRRELNFRGAILVLLSAAFCAIAVLASPKFWLMRNVANYDGTMIVAISHLSFAMLAALVVAGALLWMLFTDRGTRTDGVIGSALIASTSMMAMQDIAWIALHSGSPYSVKKHLFVVTTLTALGAARISARLFNETIRPITGPVEIAAAAVFTFWITIGHLVSAEPIRSSLEYAESASNQLHAADGAIASADRTASAVTNIIVSVVGFRHMNGGRSYLAYLEGDGGQELSKRIMVRHTADIDQKCPQQFAPTSAYSIVDSDCLFRYDVGKTLTFGTGGNAGAYLQTSEWSVAEDWGRWAVGEKGSSIKLQLGDYSGPLELRAVAGALKREDRPRIIHVKSNGEEIAVWRMSEGLNGGAYSATIPAHLSLSGLVELSFVPDETIVPGPADPRHLGIGIKSLVLTRPPHAEAR